MRNETKAKKTKILRSEKGIMLVAVALFTLVITLLGFAVLVTAKNEIALAKTDIESTRAFYLAEAGIDMFCVKLTYGINEGIEDTELGGGTCRVDYYPNDPSADSPYAIATGTYGGQTKQIMVDAVFLAPPFECSAYAGNADGVTWNFILGGTGNPTSTWNGNYGGKDIVNGNLFINGDVHLTEESSVNPAPSPNPFGLNGDVEASGTIDVYDSASISGDVNEGVAPYVFPDLTGMNYAVNNTHNVSQIFTDEGISSGYLPVGHELRDVFVKNPSDRTEECDTTTGDDFFFEPTSGFVLGGPFEGATPLNAGEDRIYYIDGDVWVSSDPTRGFNMQGKVTIVVTGDIHICDNLEYADADSILGMVALGKYNEYGELVSGGNVYFGDAVWGNMGMFSALMFAANDFLYNVNPITSESAEPDSGFTLNGSMIALNQVQIERDWYTESKYWNGWGWVETRKPCYYDPISGKWFDTISHGVLTPTQEATMTHYQMVLNYDDRVRSRDTQPPGLPRGVGTIFEGIKNWREL